MSLASQRILIVGGTSGMGLAAAQLAAARGAEVLVAGRSADKIAAAEKLGQGRIRGIAADFTDGASVRSLMEAAGRLDHLVLAASTDAAWGPFREVSVERLRRAFEGKVYGYWMCVQQALPALRRDGSIVMLTGAASRVGMPGTAGLAATNGAITQMAQTLAKELAPLRVNVISPGLVDTPVYDGMPADQKQAMFAGMAAKLPVGRVGRPEEIAEAVIFLLENEFTSGALLDVDGGAR